MLGGRCGILESGVSAAAVVQNIAYDSVLFDFTAPANLLSAAEAGYERDAS